MIPWPEASQWTRFYKNIRSVLSLSFKPTSRESKIAYLDGVRGFAAFVVYCIHHVAFAHGPKERRLNHSFGFRDEYWVANLPFVRLLFSGGGFAVALFFVISGYALSVSSMTYLHQQRPGDSLKLFTQLGCSFPRRWIRLYLPVIVTTVLFLTSWHIFNIRTVKVIPTATYLEEIGRWMNEFREGSYIWLQSETPAFGHDDYNHHIWSIAVEYRGSTIVYVLTLAFAALGYLPIARFWASLALFCYFHFVVDGPYYALFVFGMLLCDLDLGAELNPDQLPRLLRFEYLDRHRWITYILLLVGLYLGGAPIIPDPVTLATEPGWYYLSYTAPYTSSNVRWYFCVWSACLCMFSIPRLPWIKRIFESSVMQYLGKISFGFYLVHGPVMWTIGDRLYAAVGRPFAGATQTVPEWVDAFPLSDKGPLGLEINAVAPHLILLPITVWLAVIVTKTIDTPSMKLSKALFSVRPTTVAAEPESEVMLPKYADEVQGSSTTSSHSN